MCGITGMIARPGSAFHKAELLRMQAALDHRGPDGTGVHTTGCGAGADNFRFGLGHKRLSILDLSDAAHQPMKAAGDEVVLSFNGEIYNFIELREELAQLGHRFRSSGDTEVLLAAYLAWGADCVARLRGMYSFAVLDLRTSELFAARDPFGIKPFYYAAVPRGWVFASEIKSVLTCDGVNRAVNPESLLRFLRYGGSGHAEQTMFQDVQELPAGHLLRIDLRTGAVATERHYVLDPATLTTADISFDEATTRLRAMFLDSVAMHHRSDVTVGAALSGGVDSSSIVGAVRRLQGPAADIHCFTYAARGSALDEERWARDVADAAGATLHVVAPDGSDLLGEIDGLVDALDEPMSSTSLYAQHCVFRAAKQAEVKVLLDGQGADEMLGGYDRYIAARVSSLLKAGAFARAARLINASRARGIPRRRTAALAASLLSPASLEVLARRGSRKDYLPAWVDNAWFAERGLTAQVFVDSRRTPDLNAQLIADVTRNSLPHLLRYEDLNSMAFSVESRVPFLLPELVEFAVALPAEYLVSDAAENKAVLREAVRPFVPDSVLARTSKIGFAPPAGRWLDDVRGAVQDTVQRAIDGMPFLAANKVRNGESLPAADLWRLYFLTRWAQNHRVTF